MTTKFKEILEKAEGKAITRDEALHLFYETENYSKAQELFKVASKVRDNTLGTTFKWTAGVASVLPCNLEPLCLYCPYWTKPRDSLSMEEILKGVRYITEQGIREYHLSAGTTLGSEGKEMVEIVRTIRSEVDSQSKINVNCGAALSEDSIKELKKLGVTRIGASFETINEKLFQQTKPGDSLEAKKKLAEMINDAGLELGSGLLAGLGCKDCSEKCPIGAPGKLEPSRYEDYVDFMFYVKEFENLKSVYVSRFFPYTGIPLADHPRCSAMEGARIIAVMRLVLRDVLIGPAAGWSYDDIPLWVSAGGGNTIGGIHVNRTPHYRGNWYLPKALDYREGVEFCNTISTATRFLQETGMSVEY
ncbi:MAG: radical SAM protein [bacterium]|nr:radical SAM protein [bacterium]